MRQTPPSWPAGSLAMSAAESSSASLLHQLESSVSSSSAVLALLQSFAPQLLQLEQQTATGHTNPDPDTQALDAWVRDYAQKNETGLAPTVVRGEDEDGSSSSSSSAPLFFFFLHHGCGHLCTAFLSALYTDPASDQDFYWLNDPAALVEQMREKVQRVKTENRQLTSSYARTKQLDAALVGSHLTLLAGVHDLLQTLKSTRQRALAARMDEVDQLVEEVSRDRVAVQWQLFLVDSSRSGVLLALDEALAATDADSWHHSIAARRSTKSSSHARAFRAFLQQVQSEDSSLAALLVDEEYSEESELYVDRLWSLASNSFQHQGHMDDDHSAEEEQQQVSWTYPPPSMHSLLEVFFLPESAAAQPVNTAAPPPSYKVWLLYYLLVDFESRSSSPVSVSQEFALQAGLNQRQCTLLDGMVHMDAAYEADADTDPNSPLSSDRRASFLRALDCFSGDFDAVLSQADFPLVSALLASVVVLRQSADGVTFFQNLFLANDAAATAANAVAINAKASAMSAQLYQRRTETQSTAVSQGHVVFYSTLHYAFYVHILLEQGLAYESVQFIRRQAEVDGGASNLRSVLVNSPLQLTLWTFWNHRLLQQRKYHVLLKHIALGPVEEEVVLSYWRKKLVPTTKSSFGFASTNEVESASTKDAAAKTLSPADLIILYHFEHNAIARGLRFHRRFQTQQAKVAHSQRVHLRLPAEMIAAYAKLVQFDSHAAADVDEDDESDEHALDLDFIQLRGLAAALTRQQKKNAPFLAELLAAPLSDSNDLEDPTADLNRPGADLNPFSNINVNERARTEAAAAAVVTSAAAAAAAVEEQAVRQASPAKEAMTDDEPIPAAAAAEIEVVPAAPLPETKSPEVTPRVQKVSSVLSAAKARRAAQAKEDAEELAKVSDEQVQMDDDEDEEDAVVSFPSFATPAATRTSSRVVHSTPSPKKTPVAVANHGTPSSMKAVLLSNTKPLAFSDVTAGSEPTTGAAFMLPLAEETQPQQEDQIDDNASEASATSTASRKSARVASKRSTRSAKPTTTDGADEDSSFTTILPAAILPDASKFAPSLLAPSASAASARIKSSRKRPLLAQVPTHLPLATSTSAPAYVPQLLAGDVDTSAVTRSAIADRATRRRTRVSEDSTPMQSDHDTTAPSSPKRRSRSRSPSVKPTPSTRARMTRRAAASSTQPEEEDVEMEDLAAPLTTRASRRAAAASPAPMADLPQRTGSTASTSSRRAARTGPIFIDESLLLAAGDDDEEVEAATAAAPKRPLTRAARVSLMDSATPSPAASTASSPVRQTRALRKTAASPAPLPTPARSTRTRAAAAAAGDATLAPTPARRTTRHAHTDSDELPPVPTTATRTRSKAK